MISSSTQYGERFWKDVVENSLTGVIIVDESLKIRYVNRIIEITTGYTKEEFRRMSVFELIPEEEHHKILDAYRKGLGGEQIFMENRYITKDKQVRWAWGFILPAEIGGERIGVTNWIDITGLKRYEKKLRESEEFHRSLIEEFITPVAVIQDGRLVYVNRIFEKNTGYRKDELIGKDPLELLVHPEDRDLFKRCIDGGNSKDYEIHNFFRIKTKSGRERWMAIRLSEITYRGREAVAITSVDMTELHRLTEELRRKNEYLSLLNKVLRHDILNDLTIIRAALELKDEKLIKAARSRVDRISELIDEIKILEEAGKEKRVLNLAEVVREIAEMYRDAAVVKLNLEDVHVSANEGIKTVIQNVLNNAVKHSERFPVEIEIETMVEGDWIVLRIADNGRGVPDEIKAKIFDEGFTTGGGSGLGLFIVKNITELYGGKVEVKDNDPSGAVFEIRLPKSF
ncbi:sensor histidine kinase [Archaeoglobus neptunius]|uniref:sensor histidine kinase n=1 Tax=Archaeoglobus neptunius TaxID=2798580 RepID=UPI0019290281|nr:PAS domain-containing sensor histidine kinase [Archaeoglobus neptunius]